MSFTRLDIHVIKTKQANKQTLKKITGRPIFKNEVVRLFVCFTNADREDNGRGRTYAFGVYIGHKICHRVLATSATLLSQADITMSEGPKDQKGRCPASKQVISCLMALK